MAPLKDNSRDSSTDANHSHTAKNPNSRGEKVWIPVAILPHTNVRSPPIYQVERNVEVKRPIKFALGGVKAGFCG